MIAISLFALSYAPSLPPLPAQAAAPVRELTVGLSGQGRPIIANQFGDGPHKLVVVSNTHGGPEQNTYWLALQLIEHFRANPKQVPPSIRLYIIPTLNPDGLALNTRFDASGVDLNRNMNTNLDACPENDWSITVNGARGIVSDTGGSFPESQIESQLIRDFLLDASGAIFLHSNAGLVFPALCDHAPSIQMAQVYAEAAGYLYNRFWPNYLITGGMHDWAASLGIAAITPELLTAGDSEFAQNLAGIQAVLAQPEALLPLPEDQVVGDIVVPALIWRYWRAHGGEAVFGLPLQPAQPTTTGLAQTFTRARLELQPDLADTSFLIQPAMLGVANVQARSYGGDDTVFMPADSSTAPLFFASTGHSLREAFLNYWQRHGGLKVFGYPLSEEFTATTADGQRRIVQYFERAVFAYYLDDGSVRPEPLGWQSLLREGVDAHWLAPQVR
ncbi:MAG: M14 family metallopeptidase [Chloroflexales bacterium]|nr:M14 family metallopeptidase [Chloroflexales bacterium]